MKYYHLKQVHNIVLNKSKAIERTPSIFDDVNGDVNDIVSTTVKNTLRGKGPVVSVAWQNLGYGYGNIKSVEVVNKEVINNSGTFTNVPILSTSGIGDKNNTFFNFLIVDNIIELMGFTTTTDKWKIGDEIVIDNASININADLILKVTEIEPKEYSFPNIACTGGNGTGATFNITLLKNGNLNIVKITGGTNYRYNDVLTFNSTNFNGLLQTFDVDVQSTDFQNVYNNIAVSGGTGSGLKLNVIIEQDGGVRVSYISDSGKNYTFGDSVTISDTLLTNNGAGVATFTITSLNKKSLGYTWKIPSLNLSDTAKLKVTNIVSTNAKADKIYTIRCKDVQGYDSMLNLPIIYSRNGLKTTFDDNILHTIINPRNINTITLIFNDDIDIVDSGIYDEINFQISLQIMDYAVEEMDNQPPVKSNHYINKSFSMI